MSVVAAPAVLPEPDRRLPALRLVTPPVRRDVADVYEGLPNRRAILWRARDLATLAEAHAGRAQGLGALRTGAYGGVSSPT